MSIPETTYGPGSVAEQDATRTLFGQTMGLVAVTAALFALGAYLGRDMSGGGFLWFIAAIACLIGLNFAIQRSEQLAIGLLFGFGVLDRARDRADDRLLRGDEPAGGLAGGRGDRALHRRLRRGRLRDAARPLGARAGLSSGRCSR